MSCERWVATPKAVMLAALLAAYSMIANMATLQAAATHWKRACRWLSFMVFVSRSLLCGLSEPSPFLPRTVFEEKENWVNPINLQRNVFREYRHLVSDLAHQFRMLPNTFSTLLDLVSCELAKQETVFRQPVTVEERFALRLV